MSDTAGGPAAGARSPGSQAALRQRNEQRIVEALAALGSATQVEIASYTRLSAATVSNIVKRMALRGVAITTPTVRSGRRALSVRLNTEGAVAVGIDFGRSHVRVILAGHHRALIAECARDLPIHQQAAESIDVAAALLTELLAEHGLDERSILGVGVGIPGPVDRRTWTIVAGRDLPEWEGIPVLDELRRRIDHPIYVDNDANFGALAQVTWGDHEAVENLVFIKIGRGIGCGLIINGALFYGHLGITGELGHATVDPYGPTCMCGNRGCLETVASTTVMIERLRHATAAVASTEDILDHAGRGDPATLRVVEDAGLAVGRALADVSNLINPQVIVVGGPLAGLGETLLAPIRRGLVRNALPVIGETTSVVASSLGPRSEVLGAAALVLQRHSPAGGLATGGRLAAER